MALSVTHVALSRVSARPRFASRTRRAAYSRSRRDEIKRSGADRWLFPRLILPADEARFRADVGDASDSDVSEAAPEPKRRRT